jgi:hypothetical protein
MLDLFEVRHLGDPAIDYVTERLRSGGTLGNAVIETTDLRDGIVTALLPRALSEDQAVDFERSILPRSELKRSTIPHTDLVNFVEQQREAKDLRSEGRLTTEVRTLPDGDHEIVEYETHDLFLWVTTEIHTLLSSAPDGLCVIQHWISSKDRWVDDLAAAGLKAILRDDEVYLVVYSEDDFETLDRSIRAANAPWRRLVAVCSTAGRLALGSNAGSTWAVTSPAQMVAVSAYDGNACLLWQSDRQP